MMNLRKIQRDSWAWILRNIVFHLGDLATGQKMIHRLQYLEDAQWWDHDRILQTQNHALRRLIKIAYKDVDFYRELMDQAGVKPNDIQESKDLMRLPVVTKDMLRRNYPEHTSRATGYKTYEACTSGSTGENFCVKEDAETAGWYRAAFILALEWAGWQFGEPHVQTGMTVKRSPDRKLKDILLRCHYVNAADLRDANLEATLNLLEKHKIKYLWGYPGSIYLLAKFAIMNQWNQSLRSVVTWGDTLYSHYRETIEAVFNVSVFDTYGCAEGIQIAAQCDQGSYHIHSLNTIIEFLDDDGLPVKSGEIGNIVTTRLHPGPMPLIRYRVGDLGIDGENKLCSCGRGLNLMDSIQGRDTDIIITPSGNRLIVHFFTGILENFPEVDAFQVIQESEKLLLIHVVPVNGLAKSTQERIISVLHNKGAQGMEIHIELVKDIPISPSGKRRFVISKISQKNMMTI